jgi:uncharacterized membrane-anchored protein
MAYAVIHHFAGGARANYEASIDTPILTGLGLAGINAEARRPAAQQRARRYGGSRSGIPESGTARMPS